MSQMSQMSNVAVHGDDCCRGCRPLTPNGDVRGLIRRCREEETRNEETDWGTDHHHDEDGME